MHRTQSPPRSASSIPPAVIEKAYRDLLDIHRAGLDRQFLDEYQAAVVSRDWMTGYDPLSELDRDMLATDLARFLGQDP